MSKLEFADKADACDPLTRPTRPHHCKRSKRWR